MSSYTRPDEPPNPRLQELIVLLSVQCNQYDISLLSRYFKSHSEYDVVNDFDQASTRLSNSDRSSLRSSYSSLRSMISSTSKNSKNSATSRPGAFDQHHIPQTPPDETPQYLSYHPQNIQQRSGSGAESRFRQEPSPLGKISPQWQSLLPQTPTSSFHQPSIAQSQNIVQICTACDKFYRGNDPKGKLARHQRDKCEKVEFWICHDCPTEKRSPIERRDKLRKHHLDVHTNICKLCPRGGKVAELSTECKINLEKSKQEYPKKKSWGCPLCPACFHSLEEWRRHEEYHQTKDLKRRTWSTSRMIESLLTMSLHLGLAASYYDWRLCTWPEDSFEEVRFALERHEIPGGKRSDPRYASLSKEEALVLYAYDIGSAGNTFSRVSNQPTTMNSVSSTPNTCKPLKEPASSRYPPNSTKGVVSSQGMDVDQSIAAKDPLPDLNQSYPPEATIYYHNIAQPSPKSQHPPPDASTMKMFDQEIIDTTGEAMPGFSPDLVSLAHNTAYGRSYQSSYGYAAPEPKRLKFKKSLQNLVHLPKGSKASSASISTSVPPNLPSPGQEPCYGDCHGTSPIVPFASPLWTPSSNSSHQRDENGNMDIDMFTNHALQAADELEAPEEVRLRSAGGFYDDSEDDFDTSAFS